MRILRRAAAVVAVLGIVAGCSSVARPPGDGLLRYRDQVFDGIVVTRDVEYATAPSREGGDVPLTLDVYQPRGDTVTARPAVVWVHGGGFSGGDKAQGVSPTLARTFARLGYVAVSINYRVVASRRCFGAGATDRAECLQGAMDAVDDARAAVRWLRANAPEYGIDPTRIGIGGESAGAIAAAGVGLSAPAGAPDRVGGWVSISGGLPGGALVDPGDAPGYLFAGTEDYIVPYAWSAETAAAMQRTGTFVVLNTLRGAGHVPFDENRELIETQSAYFFYDRLDLEDAPVR